MAALHLLPPPEAFTRIVLPGDEENGPIPTAQECLDQAMQWLNAARSLTSEQSAAPPTSLHVVAPAGAQKR
jgi:hypothetical protein